MFSNDYAANNSIYQYDMRNEDQMMVYYDEYKDCCCAADLVAFNRKDVDLDNRYNRQPLHLLSFPDGSCPRVFMQPRDKFKSFMSQLHAAMPQIDFEVVFWDEWNNVKGYGLRTFRHLFEKNVLTRQSNWIRPYNRFDDIHAEFTSRVLNQLPSPNTIPTIGELVKVVATAGEDLGKIRASEDADDLRQYLNRRVKVLPLADSEDVPEAPTTSEDVQEAPTTSEDVQEAPTTSEDVQEIVITITAVHTNEDPEEKKTCTPDVEAPCTQTQTASEDSEDDTPETPQKKRTILKKGDAAGPPSNTHRRVSFGTGSDAKSINAEPTPGVPEKKRRRIPLGTISDAKQTESVQFESMDGCRAKKRQKQTHGFYILQDGNTAVAITKPDAESAPDTESAADTESAPDAESALQEQEAHQWLQVRGFNSKRQYVASMLGM